MYTRWIALCELAMGKGIEPWARMALQPDLDAVKDEDKSVMKRGAPAVLPVVADSPLGKAYGHITESRTRRGGADDEGMAPVTDSTSRIAPDEVAALIERLREHAYRWSSTVLPAIGRFGAEDERAAFLCEQAAAALESLSAATPVQPATREFSNRERDAMRNALARVLAGETDDFDVDAGQSALGKLRGVSAK